MPRISELPSATAVNAADLVPFVQSGVTKQTPASNMVSAVTFADYASLRAYTGDIKTAKISGYLVTAAPAAIAGEFTRDDNDTTTADNGGTVIVTSAGKRWKRIFVGGVSPEWFGTVASSADATSIVQSAINTGLTVDLKGKSYNVHGLTVSTNGQALVSSQGIGRLVKNANGAVITITADDFHMENVGVRGDAATPTFTGDGIVCTGERPSFINCGSRWISGTPLIATKNRVKIKGTCDLYQTTDVTANGWDIIIGTFGVATLYHELDEVYSSQSTGGIKLIDTGSHTIKGGLFGKLYIAKGTLPAGVNGGKTIGARIVGNVTVEQSNTIFTANQFSAIAITFALGTAQCVLDESNIFGTGATITNNGNANNLIIQQIGTGGVVQLKYGDDAATSSLTISTNDPSQQFAFSGSMSIPNTRSYQAKLADGTVVTVANISSGNVLSLGGLSYTRTDVAGPFINLVSSAGTQAQVVDGGVRPFTDNTKTLGSNTLRWLTVNTYNVSCKPVTVANLIGASGNAGLRAFVSDSTVAGSGNFGAIVAGGGTNNVPVYSDGTNWRIG